jgi:hypothetical protein
VRPRWSQLRSQSKTPGASKNWRCGRDARRLVAGQPEPYRALAALHEGAGVELGVALAAQVEDVDRRTHPFHARGTKNAWRDRFVRIEDWAWPYILEACGRKSAGRRLFEGATEARARPSHRRAVMELQLDARYRIHDARHSYTVMRLKRGERRRDRPRPWAWGRYNGPEGLR